MQVIYKIFTRPGKGEETRAYCISVVDWSMLSRSTIGSADDSRDTTTQTVWWDITEKSLTIVCEPIVPLMVLIL